VVSLSIFFLANSLKLNLRKDFSDFYHYFPTSLLSSSEKEDHNSAQRWNPYLERSALNEYSDCMTMLVDNWNAPPANLTLAADEVHVWCASLNQPQAYRRQLAQTLSADEWTRADRFHFNQDKEHFIVGRGLLRTILGRYQNSPPADLQFCYGSYGKPGLVTSENQPTLCFNLSHSHGLVLYGFTLHRAIGVDLEYIRPIPDLEQIVERFFSASEQAVFAQLPPHQQLLSFFQGWTCKEAYLKATGEGLTQPLQQIEVSMIPGTPARLLRAIDNRQSIFSWSLRLLEPGDSFMVAITVEGKVGQLKRWRWSY
jgi:4'-phosphopantetheinyl transferase